MRRVAFYGGTFDPVHVGHLDIARRLSALFAFDEFCFIPAHLAPHKRGAVVTPGLHRYAMLALATQQIQEWRISTIELDAPERPFTIDTLTRLIKHHEADEAASPAPTGAAQTAACFFFVMGADSWLDITTWREWERLLQLTNHIVVTRPGYELSHAHVSARVCERIVDLRGMTPELVRRELNRQNNDPKIYITDAVMMNVSATMIRRAVRCGEDHQHLLTLVPPSIADYIKKYGLYMNKYERELTDQATSIAR